MRIHHIINLYSLRSGGAERLVQRLHVGLHGHGIESFILGLMPGDGEVAYTCSLGVESPYQWNAFRGIRRYIIENVKAGDIVHAHLFPTNLYLSILKKTGIVKVPLICTEHNTSNRRRGKLIGRIVDSFTYAGYDQVVSISQGTERSLLQWKPELYGKTSVVTNGTTLQFTNSIIRDKKERVTILSVGMLSSQKNYDTAFKAIFLLKNIDFEYQIAGSGQNLERLKQQCTALGLESKVQFLGYVEDVPTLLTHADIFLMPSKWEGFGLAAVEAMNASLPIVASDVPGLREVVDHQPPCALLVNPESPESIANALQALCDSYEKRQTLGSHAFEHAQAFSEQKMIEGYLSIYAEVLANEA